MQPPSVIRALVREEGEVYRLGWSGWPKSSGVKKHVVFFNRFVELEEWMRFIRARDISFMLYFNKARITSGMLPYPRLRKQGESCSNRSSKNALVFGGA